MTKEEKLIMQELLKEKIAREAVKEFKESLWKKGKDLILVAVAILSACISLYCTYR